MIRFYFLTLLAVLFVLQLNAQHFCGSTHVNEQLEINFPHIAEVRKQNEALIRQALARRSMLGTDYVIPVVVHVIHTGGAIGSIYNPDEADINEAIDILNGVWNGSFPGMTPPGSGVAGDMQIQFAMAQRTPSCGATNGIVRYDASGISAYVANGVNSQNNNGLPDADLKALSHWPGANYYNIYIVNKIDGWDGTMGGGIAGYAYFPGAPENLDGTVVLATQIANEKVLAHELGHALNLYHTFEGSTDEDDCPPNANCETDNDRVCDTDPVSLHTDCRTGTNGCNGMAYSILTENNVMGYTNCTTLFTSGQKDRAQAAMMLPSRLSLAISDGDLPCAPEINFSLGSLSAPESQSTTIDGCRRYMDYTFQLTIGVAPSATTTVTIDANGTAVTDLDYLLTTNDNFNNPSNEVIFPTGSNAAQQVKIRVFDDLNAEGTEYVEFTLTIDANGGNAVGGTINPSLTVTIADNDAIPGIGESGTSQIGTYDVNSPLGVFDQTTPRTQTFFIIRASDIATAGIPINATLNSLGMLIIQKNTTVAFNNFSISLGHTPLVYIYDNGNLAGLPTFQTVYTNASVHTFVGQNHFNFSSNFQWNGTDNIMVKVCWDNGSAGSDNDVIAFSGPDGTADQFSIIWSPNTCANPISSFSGVNNGWRPMTYIGWETESYQIEDAVTTAPAAYMSVGSHEHIYSENDKVVCSISQIDQLLGCVSAGIVSAGNTWIDGTLGQRSGKIFEISPSSNESSASYTATFYFKEAELAGKNPATLRLAKSTAPSEALIDEDNTVFLPATYVPFGPDAMFTADFSGFSLFFLVDEDFILPVELLHFSAEKAGQSDVVVRWLTSSEDQLARYELERSSDGRSFLTVNTQQSVWDRFSQNTYKYSDMNIPPGVYFYRLKIVGLDESFVYSSIAKVDFAKGSSINVYPTITGTLLTVEGAAELAGNWAFTIFDIRGERVFNDRRTGQLVSHSLNVANLPPGIYLLRIDNENRSEVFKFVRE